MPLCLLPQPQAQRNHVTSLSCLIVSGRPVVLALALNPSPYCSPPTPQASPRSLLPLRSLSLPPVSLCNNRCSRRPGQKGLSRAADSSHGRAAVFTQTSHQPPAPRTQQPSHAAIVHHHLGECVELRSARPRNARFTPRYEAGRGLFYKWPTHLAARWIVFQSDAGKA